GLTDGLGQYRFYGLAPVTYVLSSGMSMSGSTMIMSTNGGMTTVNANEGYVTTYFPGTASIEEAQTVTVALGQEASADMALIAAKLAKVSGTIRDSQGHAVAGANVTLRSAGSVGMIGPPSFARAAADGSFTLANVSPGEHFIDVRPGPGTQEFATVPVVVAGQDIAGLIITTSSGTTVAGHVIFDGTSPHPLPGPSVP